SPARRLTTFTPGTAATVRERLSYRLSNEAYVPQSVDNLPACRPVTASGVVRDPLDVVSPERGASRSRSWPSTAPSRSAGSPLRSRSQRWPAPRSFNGPSPATAGGPPGTTGAGVQLYPARHDGDPADVPTEREQRDVIDDGPLTPRSVLTVPVEARRVPVPAGRPRFGCQSRVGRPGTPGGLRGGRSENQSGASVVGGPGEATSPRRTVLPAFGGVGLAWTSVPGGGAAGG